MKTLQLPQLLLVSTLLTAVLCGRITPWGDPIMTNPNVGKISTMTLYFSLDTTLPAGHLLRVAFPFVNQTTIASVSVTGGSLSSVNYAAKYQNAASPYSTYFTFGSDLKDSTTYTMVVTFGTSPQDSAGFLGYVQMETMSPADSIVASGSDTPISYDSNNAFAPVIIYPAPLTPTFSSTSTDANANLSSQTYIRTFSIQPNATIYFPAIIWITWDQASATASSCSSVNSGISATNATAFTSSQASCTVSGTKAVITLNQQWLQNQTQVWSMSMTNPSSAITVTYSAYIMHKYNNNMTDINLGGASFTVQLAAGVTSTTITATKIQLSWGVDRAVTSSTFTATHQKIFKLYAGNAASYKQYQGMKFIFGASSALSGNYVVTLGLCAGTVCDALENSISASVSSFCLFTQSTNTAITCWGVTSIAASGNYIQARVFIDSTMVSGSNTISDSQFGVITVTSGSTTLTGSLDAGYKDALILTTTNDWLYNYNGNGPLIAMGASDTLWTNVKGQNTYAAGATGTTKTAAGGIFGTNSSSTSYSMMLITKAVPATFSSPTPTSPNYNKQIGVDLFMNPNVFTAPSSTKITACSVGSGPNSALAGIINTASANTNTHCFTSVTSAYTRVRNMVVGGTAATTTNFNTATPAFVTFAWENVVSMSNYTGTVEAFGTLLTDFYGAFYDFSTLTNANFLATASGNSVTDLGELGTSNLVSGSNDFTMTANYFFFHAPILAPSTMISGNYGASTRKVFIAGANAEADNLANTTGSVMLLRIRTSFSTANDFIPASGKLAIFIKTPASAGYFEPLGGVGTTYNGSSPIIGNAAVRCFSGGATQVCNQIRKPRVLPASAPQWLDLAQIITSDVTYTNSFTLSVVIKPKKDLATYTFTYRLGFITTTGYYYIEPADKTFDGTMAGSGTPRTLSNPCVSTDKGFWFSPANTDAINSNISSATLNFVTIGATNTYAALTNYFGGGIYCVSWDFRNPTTTINSTTLENSSIPEKCWHFDFQSTESTTQYWYCVFCPVGQAMATATTTISVNNMKSSPYQSIPTNTFGNFISDAGVLVERFSCTASNPNPLYQPNNITSMVSSGIYLGLTGQKVTFSFNTASTLAKVTTITITGKQSGGSTTDTSFPYGNLDSNYICKLTTSTSLTNTPANYVGCTATQAAGSISVSISGSLTTAQQAITSWVIVLWGFVGNVTTSSTSVLFAVTTSGLGSIDAPYNSATGSMSIANISSTALTVSNIKYHRPYLGARSYIRWDFQLTTQRPFFYMDKLIFNIDSFTSATVNSNTAIVKCRITDQNDVILPLFRSCTYTVSGNTLTIQPLNFGAQSNSFLELTVNSATNAIRVYLGNLNVVASITTKTVYGSLQLFGAGANSITSLSKTSVATDFPTLTTVTSFPTGYPTVSKVWAAPYVFSDLIFTLISSAATSDSNRIVIAFPSYYQVGLSTRATAPYCSVNGNPNACSVETRNLIINGVGTAINANTAITIRVSGIAAPGNYTTTEAFWVQIQSDLLDPGTLIYGGTVQDTAFANQVISPMNVNWWSVSTSNTRVMSTMTWTFNALATADIDTTKVVQVVFPESWGIAYMTTQPTCQVIDASTTANYGNKQYIFGNILSVNLTTTIPKMAPCYLQCSNMKTPENDTTWSTQDIIIRTADANGTNVYLHSAIDNVNYGYSFTKGTGLTYTEWGSYYSMAHPLTLTRGTYSGALTLYVSGGQTTPTSFAKSFQVTTTNTNFGFYPAQFNVTTGQYTASSKLGTSATSPLGTYLLTFALSDSTTYTAPGSLWVTVTTNVISLTPSPATDLTTYYVNATTLVKTVPIMFDVSAYPPYTDITITPWLAAGNTNFTVSPTSITLSAASPTGYFVYSTTATTSATGANTVSYNISGTNSKTYTCPTIQTISVIADSTGQASITPNLTITAGTDQIATTKQVTFSLSNIQFASVYYVVGLAGQISSDAATIKNSTSASYNQNSQDQAQYGLVSQYSTLSSSGISPAYITISNLFPSTNYQINAFAVSQFGLQSSVVSTTFTTASNGNSISRWLFNFTGGYPTSNQRQALLCALSTMIAAPYQCVRNIHGEICSNTTAFYSTSQQNISGNASMLAVYFYPLPVNTDTSATLISSLMNNNQSTMQTALKAVASTPALQAVTLDIQSISSTAPTPTFATTGVTGTTWVQISGLKMSDSGFIWIAISPTSNATATPTALKLKAAGTQASTGYTGYSVQYYYVGGSTVSYNFTGLGAGTTYTVYMLGSNNDPSWLQSFTSVQTISVVTQATNTASFAVGLSSISMLALAMMLSFLAMF